jgi:hypothetical protein
VFGDPIDSYLALSVSTPIHQCHAWHRGYCGHGFEAAKLGEEDSLCRVAKWNFPPRRSQNRAKVLRLLEASAVTNRSSSGEESHPSALTGRVGDWRAGLGRSLCSLLPRPFGCEVSQHLDRATFPAPATSNAACGFPALRSPVCFASRVMGPILLGHLSTAATGPCSC